MAFTKVVELKKLVLAIALLFIVCVGLAGADYSVAAGTASPTPTPAPKLTSNTATAGCVCPSLWEPVCGSDGKTYANKCIAACSNIQISYYGECKAAESGQITAAVSRVDAADEAFWSADAPAARNAAQKMVDEFKNKISGLQGSGYDVAALKERTDSLQKLLLKIDGAIESRDKVQFKLLAASFGIEAVSINQRLSKLGENKVTLSPQYVVISANARALDANGVRIALSNASIAFSLKDGRLAVKLPVLLNRSETLSSFTDSDVELSGRQLKIILRQQGEKTAELTAQVSDAVGADGGAEAQVQSLRLDTVEREVPAAAEAGAVLGAVASLSVDLKNFPERASITVKPTRELSTATVQKFEEAAAAKKLRLKKRLASVEVAKEVLTNERDVSGARIRIAVDYALVAANGGPEKARILRESDGAYEVLPTTYVGNDAEGRAVFEAQSSGLSVFAVYMADTIASESTATPEAVLGQASFTPTPETAAAKVVANRIDLTVVAFAIVIVIILVGAALFAASGKRRRH